MVDDTRDSDGSGLVEAGPGSPVPSPVAGLAGGPRAGEGVLVWGRAGTGKTTRVDALVLRRAAGEALIIDRESKR